MIVGSGDMRTLDEDYKFNITLLERAKDSLYEFNRKTGLYEITGFGREYEYLLKHGYEYDSLTKSMIKKGW